MQGCENKIKSLAGMEEGLLLDDIELDEIEYLKIVVEENLGFFKNGKSYMEYDIFRTIDKFLDAKLEEENFEAIVVAKVV